MVVFKLKRGNLNKLLLEMKKTSEVYVPVKNDIVKFELLDDLSKIDLSKNSYYPIKEHFFKKEEVLFKFDDGKFIPVKKKIKDKIFFGLRRCDLNAIKHQDLIFINQHKDPYYDAERKKSLLIGYHCNTAPDKHCFCESMDLEDYYDLMFFDRKNYLIVDVKTEKGKLFLKKFKKFFEKSSYVIKDKDRYIKTKKLNKKDINHLYNHKDWKKGVDLCLSCTACTDMCPTCYCHEIKESVEISDLKKGHRSRIWSSCQVKDFTKVAGGHVFREKREERFKHRIYHQIQYFREKNGITLCTGCGRCITGCPTKIDWVKIINEMK